VQAPVDYAALDAPGSATRIRLSSAVVRVYGGRVSVQEDGARYGHPSPVPVRVAYVRDGKVQVVSGRHVVLACYTSLIPRLVPARDIVAITVNRWPLGYAYTYDTLGDPDVPPEHRPHVVGRQRFGPIAIANADAGAAAFTNQAIDEAHRAVEELLVARGLT